MNKQSVEDYDHHISHIWICDFFNVVMFEAESLRNNPHFTDQIPEFILEIKPALHSVTKIFISM
jgi:hypothetical protein